MKTTIFLFSIMLFISTTRLSAQGLYIKAQSGYAFGNESEADYVWTETGTSSTEENVYYSFGQGVSYGLSVGYLFNPSFGVELGYSRLQGVKHSISDSWSFGNSNSTDQLSANNVSASLVYHFNENKFSPYAKAGAVASSARLIRNGQSNYDGQMNYEWESLSKGMSFGFNSALGVTYSLTDAISFFGEASLTSISFKPQSSELLKQYEGGENVLGDMTYAEIHTEFVDSITETHESVSDENVASQETGYRWAMGSIGFNFGIKITL